MATLSRSTRARSKTFQSFKKLVRHCSISHLDFVMSKYVFDVYHAASNYLYLNADCGHTKPTNAAKVRIFIKQSLPPPKFLFGNDVFAIPLFSMMVPRNIAKLHGRSTPDSSFLHFISLTTTDWVRPRTTVILWLTCMKID